MLSFPGTAAEVSLKIRGSPGFSREATTLRRGGHPAALAPRGKLPDKVPQDRMVAPGSGDHRGKRWQVGGGGGIERDPEVGAWPGTVQCRVGSHPCPSAAWRWELMSRDASCGGIKCVGRNPYYSRKLL